MNDDLHGEIKRAAKTVALEWPDVIGPDDLEQEIWINLLESRGAIDQLVLLDLTVQRAYLRKIGRQIASRERDNYAVFSGQVQYSGEDVLKLLQNRGLHTWEDVVNTSVIVTNKMNEDNRTKIHKNSSRPDDDTVDRIDLRDAMDRLKIRNSDYWAALMNFYLFGMPVQDTRGRNRIARARRALLDEMNRSWRIRWSERDGGPGSRSVINNGRAQYITRSYT